MKHAHMAREIAYEVVLRAGLAFTDRASEYHASGDVYGRGVIRGPARLVNQNEEQFWHALGVAAEYGPRCRLTRW